MKAETEVDKNIIINFITSGYDYEVIIIDDNSPDGTLEVAKQLQKIYGEEKIVGNIFLHGWALTVFNP